MPRKKPAPKPVRRRRGTGSITTLADGTIRARLPATLDPKRLAREFPPDRMAEAVAWLDGYLYPQPEEPAVVAATVEEWAGVWWQNTIEPLHPPNTARWYRYALGKLEPLYATLLPDLRASMLQGRIGELSQALGAASVQAIVGVWRRCLDAAVDDDLIARNPAVRLAKPKAAARSVRRHVTPAEATLLRAAIVGERFEAAYALLLGCGLRIGEVLGMPWSNVDLHGRRAWVEPQWTNSHWRETPKGRNPHWVALPDMVVSALIRHRNAQEPGAILVMQSPFGNRPGRKGRRAVGGPKPWSRQSMASDLAKIVGRLDLPPMTSHAYRRGLVTALLDGGVAPATVAAMVGHANSAVTLNSYSQPSDAGRERAAELVDRYLGSDDFGTDATRSG